MSLATYQLLCDPCHLAKSKKEVRHWHPAANRKAGERLRKKLLAKLETYATSKHTENKATTWLLD